MTDEITVRFLQDIDNYKKEKRIPMEELSTYECKRCGNKWVPRKANPQTCPKCKSKLWQKPKLILMTMTKRKTSLNIDDKVWTRWLTFIAQKTGTSRKVSEETVNALEEYMTKHVEDETL